MALPWPPPLAARPPAARRRRLGRAGMGTGSPAGTLKAQAMAKARALRAQAASEVTRGLAEARGVVAGVRRSRDVREAMRKVDSALQQLDESPGVRRLARGLVCLFFVNLVAEQWARWAFFRSPEGAQIALRRPAGFPPPPFPAFGVGLVLPAALLCIVGVRVPATAAVLLLDMLRDSSAPLVTQLRLLVAAGVPPNELFMKKVAICGCVALVIAHELKGKGNFTGQLLEARLDPARKAAFLLAGRVMLGMLFVFSGVAQVRRLAARDFTLFWNDSGHHDDEHDNNWLLAQFVLAVPFALGFQTRSVARILSACLALEAALCWQFWSPRFASWEYREHVRLHFVTNLSLCGGLTLLQSFGAGKYSLDSRMFKGE